MRLLALLTVAVASMLGCKQSAPETFTVRGLVSYDGTPVPTGTVIFVPNGRGGQFYGQIQSDGSYELSAPAGRYKVAVIAVEETRVGNVTKENWRKAFTSMAPRHYVPQFFSDPETSTLAYTVTPDQENSYDIQIPARKRRQH